MPTFLVESYEPRGRAQELPELDARVHSAARACGGRYVRSIFTPQDELCLHVFESPSRERLERAVAEAGFAGVRVSEAAELPAGSSAGDDQLPPRARRPRAQRKRTG